MLWHLDLGMQCKFSQGCQTPAEPGRTMCAPHARLLRSQWEAHVTQCREDGVCVRCAESMEPWRQATHCTACTQAFSDAKRLAGQRKTNRTITCWRCGQQGHHQRSCTIPPFSWEGPISNSLEQVHIPLDEQERIQRENDLATYLAHVKRLEWELSHNRGIVVRPREE